MSLNRYDKKRDSNEREIITALEAVCATVCQLSPGGPKSKGVPDLLVGFRGQTFLLEVKGPKGKLTPDQVAFFENWQGAPVVVVVTAEEALRAIGASDD